MSVKVRCPGCERVLNAPDAARGKAVKCPQCGQAVRVPAAKSAPAAKKKVAARPPSSSALIANIDLDRLEDEQTRICPKCGAEVSREDTECPECQVNLETGLLSPELLAERNRKGPNPKKYYSEFFSDSFAFWKTSLKLSIYLALFCALFVTISIFCWMVGTWCIKPLARYFWMFLSAIALFIPPGLAWNLHTTIIDATMRKKKKLPKYHFDKLLGAALGIKLLLWFLDVALPLHILAIIFLFTRFPIVSLGLEGAAIVFAATLFPLAMTHMSMPITLRGWLINKMSRGYFRTLPALMYWAFFLLLLLLVPMACVAGGALISGRGIVELARTSSANSRLKMVQLEIDDLPKTAALTEEMRNAQSKKEAALDWTPVFIPAGLCILASAFFGGTAIFLMRANGLYSRYFMDYLDLETMAPEVKYVAKAKTLAEIESAKGLTWQRVLVGIAMGGAFGLAFGGAGAAVQGKSFFVGAGGGLMIAGGIMGLIGWFWLLFEAFKDSMIWFGALLLSSQFGVAAFVFVGPLGFLISPLLALVYGLINWSNAKYPLVVHVIGYYVLFPIGLTILIVSGAISIFGEAAAAANG